MQSDEELTHLPTHGNRVGARRLADYNRTQEVFYKAYHLHRRGVAINTFRLRKRNSVSVPYCVN